MKLLKINRENFFDSYFEKEFYFEKKGLENVNYISWSEIDEVMFNWDINDDLIHIYKEGKVDPSQYTEEFYDVGKLRKKIVKDVFNNLLLNGATLVLNRIDIKSIKINRLTKVLSHFVKEKCVANGYVAFGGTGTFAKHWDTHDVFAVQLIGKKRWKLYKPTFPLPLRHQTSKEHKHECPEFPVFDEILTAGDILYIPRGWWHEAIPLENEETFHIAVGVHTASISDYITWAGNNIFGEIETFRKSLVYHNFENLEIADVEKKINNLNHVRKFRETQIIQDKTISPFNLSRISNIINQQQSESNGYLILNTSYELLLSEENSILINDNKIFLDEKSLNIFNILNDQILSRNTLLQKLCKNDTEKLAMSDLLNKLIMNDIISEI